MHPDYPALSIQKIPFDSKGVTRSLAEHLKRARPIFDRDACYMPWGMIHVIYLSHPREIKHRQLGALFPSADNA